MRFTFRLLAAVAAVALSVSVASAVPITSFGAVHGNTSGGVSGSTITFANGFTNIVNPPTVGFIGSPISDLVFTLGNWASSTSGPATISGGTFTYTNGGTAVFSITPSPITITTNNTLTGQIGFIATATLVSNTTPFDFSLFTSPGGANFNFTANGIYVQSNGASNPATWVLPGGNGAVYNSSFTVTSNSILNTPEPASLAVFGVMALGGLAVARRKFLAKRETA